MATSSGSHVVQPYLQYCGLPAALEPSASRPVGGIHLGDTEQACTLIGVLELGGGCSAILPPRGAFLGGRAACMLPSPLTLSQAIDVPWPSGGDLIIWESRNLRGVRKKWRSSAELGR